MKDRLNLVRYGGVISNSALKRGNYGSNGNTGFCIWTNSICSNRKINKDSERKKNSRRELQRGIMHCSKTLCYGGVSSTQLSFKPGILRVFQKSLKLNPSKNYP